MQDEQLADCLDEFLVAGRGQTPVAMGRLVKEISDPEDRRLVEFLARVCQFADEWKEPTTCELTEASLAETPNDSGPQALETPGMTIGRYRLLNRIAAGGMGTVYRAFDPTLGRIVAVKVPHLDPDHPRFEEIAEQFVQEARLAASVDHPNVCAVFDAGRHEGNPYAVMAFIDGNTLATRLKETPRFENVGAAIDLIRRVADGVHAAHQRKIIHRDIKPANILLRSSDGHPVLTDFGLARVTQEGGMVTRPGVVAGTVAYMAPEQADGDVARIGPATDVYALGAVLYQMVTGCLPYEGDVQTILNALRKSGSSPNPAQHRPDLDPRLVTIIRRAMARHPEDRYRDAGALTAALTLIAIGSDAETATLVHSVPGHRQRRVRWSLVGGGVAACIILLATLGWYFGRAKTLPPAPLDGELIVRIWTKPEAVEPNLRRKAGIAVDDKTRDALPVQNIDLVHLEIHLNRPAYVYVFWFPGEGGRPATLYPWNPKTGFRVPPDQHLVSEVHTPERRNGGWGIVGPSGLETAVLLAREAPLNANELSELEAEIGTLPPTPLGPDMKEVAWLWREPSKPDGWISRGTLRGIDTEQSRDLVDEPVFALLKRMQMKFDLVKAVRFAHVGDDLTGPAAKSLGRIDP